jgi:hypothetical protein
MAGPQARCRRRVELRKSSDCGIADDLRGEQQGKDDNG